jgi:hypothetical protein
LNAAFVEERLCICNDVSHLETRRFVELYREEHRLQIAAWFEQAKKEILSKC